MKKIEKQIPPPFKKKSILAVTLLLFISTLTLFAGKPGHLVDRLFAPRDKPDSPGCAVAVIQNGQIIYKKGYGMANIELNVPITPQSRFYVGSISKQFVAFCVLLLESRGKLSLDDDIGKFFPEMPDFGTPVTVRHLLHHTSGLWGYRGLMLRAGLEIDYFHKPGQAVRLLSRRKGLLFTPGERFVYSNTNYFLLGEIVHRLSGKTLRQFADEHIFKPLGMKNSFFLDDYKEIVKNRASGYISAGKGRYMNFVSKHDLVGAGGVISTAEDLYLWDQNFYNPKVGDKELIKKMLTKGVLNNQKEIVYACGIGYKEYKGLQSVLHSGSNAGYKSNFVRFPGQRFSVICLGNSRNYDPIQLCYRVADIYLKDHFKENKTENKSAPFHPVQLPLEHLQNKTGTFRDPKTGYIVHIKVHPQQKNRLLYGFEDWQLVLAPAGKTQFQAVAPHTHTTVQFEKTNHDSFLVYERYKTKEPVRYQPVKTVTPTPGELKEYRGDYYNEELDTVYRIAYRDGKLTKTIIKKLLDQPGIPLTPTIKDEFIGPSHVYRFLRDKTQKITGFYLDINWMSNLQFVKIE